MSVILKATREHTCVVCGKPIRVNNRITLVADPPAMWRHAWKPTCSDARP